jgi:hypothetical protein
VKLRLPPSLNAATAAGHTEFVLSLAAGYSPDILRPLVGSFHRATKNAQLIIVVDSAKRFAGAFRRANRCHFVEAPALRWFPLHRRKWRTWSAILSGLLKLDLLTKTNGFGAWLRTRLLHPQQSRYFIFADLVHQLPDAARVLHVDARDVAFQRNPFDEWAGGELHTGAECPTFRCSSWNLIMLAQACETVGEFESVLDKQVLCSGVSAGDKMTFVQYLGAMCRIIIERMVVVYRMPPLDQALHNLVLRNRNELPLAVHQHGDGWLATFGNANLEGCIVAPDGEVRSENGIPIAILHQYDRVPELAGKWGSRDQ